MCFMPLDGVPPIHENGRGLAGPGHAKCIRSSFTSVAQVTPEEVAAAVAKVVASEQGALQERRYLFNQNILVGKVRCAAVSSGPCL